MDQEPSTKELSRKKVGVKKSTAMAKKNDKTKDSAEIEAKKNGAGLNGSENAENDSGFDENDEEFSLEPQVKQLLDYARKRQVVSWDEMTEILTLEFVNSPKMETVIQLLNKNNIPIMDENNGMMDEDEDVDQEDDDGDSSENDISVEDESKIDDVEHHHLLTNEKDSKIDDPIRLYLREIGKERLLTADEEKKFSKKMEDGQNIIKDVIKNSGMIVPEFFVIAQKALTKDRDHRDQTKNRKEINEIMAEKKRLRSCYGQILKPIYSEKNSLMKQYVQLKKKLSENDQTMVIFQDENLQELRKKIVPELQKIDLQSEEIERFSLESLILLG